MRSARIARNRSAKPRRGLLAFSWLLRVVILLLPVCLLAWEGAISLLKNTDSYLSQAEPIISEIASEKLMRPVKVGRLSQQLSIETLWEMFRHREEIGTFAIEVDDIVIDTKKTTYINSHGKLAVYDEPTLAHSKTFVRVPRAVAYVSMPSILAGDMNRAVPRIQIESPQVTLVRSVDGELNVEHILPSNPNAKPTQPFRTVIELHNGRLRFCDYNSMSAQGKLAENTLARIEGFADLTATSNYRFEASAIGAPGTPTVNVLGGKIAVDGTWGRVNPDAFPGESPSLLSSRFLIHFNATQGDIPYWFYYFVNAGLKNPADPASKEMFRLQTGKADVTATIAAPRPDIVTGPTPGIGITFGAKFTNARVTTGYVAAAVENGRGSLDYEDGSASFSANASVLGGPIGVAGSLWNLTPPMPGGKMPTPGIAINVHAAHMAGDRVFGLIQTLMPKNTIPPQLHAGGDLGVDALVSGQANDPIAVARVSGVEAAYDNFPSIHRLAGNVEYAAGVIGLTSITGTIDGGGSLTGHAAVRAMPRPGAKGTAGNAAGDAQFSVHAGNVDLHSLAVVRKAVSGLKSTMQPSGRGTVDAVGTMTGGTLNAAANVTTDGLMLGKLAFPVARARILATRKADGSFTLTAPEARIESPAGAVSASAQMLAAGKMKVQWAASSLDIRSLMTALGLNDPKTPELSGLVSASGTVTGTAKDPRLTVDDLSAINLRAGITGSDGVARRFAIDSVRGTDIVATLRGVALNRSLVVRRFPATISVAGSITNIQPVKVIVKGKSEDVIDPHLKLTATLHDLDVSEIDRQLAVDVGRAAREKLLGGGKRTGPPPAAPVSPDTSELSGAVTAAKFDAVGPISHLIVSGSAELGQMLLGDYPVDGGTLDFAYHNYEGVTHISNATLTASVGTVTADATVHNTGEVSGTFDSRKLDLEKVAYLLKTEGAAASKPTDAANSDLNSVRVAPPVVTGAIAINGSVSGSVHRLVVNADIPASTLRVYGVTLTDVTAHGIRFTDNLDEQESRIEATSISLRQSPQALATVVTPSPTPRPAPVALPTPNSRDATVTLSNVSVELPGKVGQTGNVSATLNVEVGDISGLIGTLRAADLLHIDPSNVVGGPIKGAAAIDHLQIQGRLTREKNGEGVAIDRFIGDSGDATFSAANVNIGKFSMPTVAGHATLAGDRIHLENLTASSTGATYRAHGFVGLDKTIDLVLESNAASIDSIRTIPSLQSLPLSGDLDLSVLVKGSFERPSVTATVESTNAVLLFGSDTPPPATALPATAAAAALPATSNQIRFPLDVLRATVQYDSGVDGKAMLTISDALIKHLGASIQVSGTIPVDAGGASTDRRIALSVVVPTFDLKDVSMLMGPQPTPPSPDVLATEKEKKRSFLAGLFSRKKKISDAKAADLGGTFAMTLNLTNTISEPELSGDLTLQKGHFVMPKPRGDDKDHVNPIDNVDAHLVFSGRKILFDTLNVALGGPNGKKGNYGSVGLTGDVTVGILRGTNLKNLLHPSGNNTAAFSDNMLDSPIDLKMAFKDFRPVDDNLFQFGEYLSGVANGNLTLTNTVRKPLIATENGTAIHITSGTLSLTSAVSNDVQAAGKLLISPTFSVPISIDGKATVSPSSLFKFEVTGNALIAGGLPNSNSNVQSNLLSSNSLSVKAKFKVVGGTFDLPPLAHFKIQSVNPIGAIGSANSPITAVDSEDANTVELRYGSTVPGVIAHHVIAVTHQTVRDSANLGAYAKTVNGVFVESNQAPTTNFGSQSQQYTITADIDGPLNILNTDVGGGEAIASGTQKQLVTFTSQPYLSSSEILALLGAQDTLNGGGDNSAVANSFVNRAIYNSLVPQYLAPITDGVQSWLNLEDFSVSYDPTGYSQVFLARRLPAPFDKPPFDRFLVQYTQQFQTRSSTQLTDQQPYLFTLSYDLFDLKQTGKLKPRVQVGFSTDDQHVNTYFLRSSASF